MSGPTFAALVILVEVQRCCLRETVGGTISASLLSLCLTQFREFIYLGIMKILQTVISVLTYSSKKQTVRREGFSKVNSFLTTI